MPYGGDLVDKDCEHHFMGDKASNLVPTFQLKDEGIDSSIVEAEPGCAGKQSPTFYRFDLWDAEVQLKIAEIFAKGAEKYGADNWKHIPSRNHLNKALIHIWGWISGNREDDHLLHAAWRVMAAYVVHRDKEVIQ